MGKLSGTVVPTIVAIAIYFALFWGFDALRILTSPSYGLDDVWRSQVVFALGGALGLGPIGLLKLAAFLGTIKLAVAGICAVHCLDRLRTLGGGKADTEVLEGGLILVVALSIASAGPAVWSQSVELVREDTIQLLLAAVATALCMVERNGREQTEHAAIPVELAATPRGAPWYSPFR